MTTARGPRMTLPTRLLQEADLALSETAPGVWQVVKHRTGANESNIDWLRRQTLIDENFTRALVYGTPERLLEKRFPMPLCELSGNRVATDEHEARTAYPHVCWEHPQLYPGIMVPNWAVALRDACNRVGLSGFGRDLLVHVKRLFPKADRAPEREEKLQAAYEDGEDVSALEEAFRAEDKEDLEREAKALQTVKAAIAVIDLEAGGGEGLNVALTENARDALAMKVCDVLEAGGMTYCSANNDKLPGEHHRHLDKAGRIRLNLITARDIERTALLTAARLSKTAPRARFA